MSELFAGDGSRDAAARPGAGEAPGCYVRVVVERGIDRVGRGGGGDDRTLSYGVPQAMMSGPVRVGQRVLVPLGRSDTPVSGFVVAVGGEELLVGADGSRFDPARVKMITRLAGGAGLSPLLVKLGSWMSEYYVAPLGMVYGTMLPAAVKRETGSRATVYVERGPGPFTVEISTLSKRLAEAWLRIEALPETALPTTVRALAAMLDGVSEQSVKKLIELGGGRLVTTTKREVEESRDWVMDHVGAAASTAPTAGTHTLSDAQAAALGRIEASLGTFAVHLLHGVTGSGKTEVYLRAIEAMLARAGGKEEGQVGNLPHASREQVGNLAHAGLAQAIMLVPEIALTPQTAGRFTARFGDRVAVLHSGLTGTQRHAQWLACASGRVQVVVGARSAVFAPLPRVGLIIVDEEHDSSYKQDQVPRYHGRDVAIKRGQLEGCPVVLGSATPSLESWANASSTEGGGGKYTLSSLPSRVGGARLPSVQIVDLAEERRRRALVQPEGWRDRHLHLIGPTLEQAIGDTLTARGQVLLLLNRRGYANYICCTDPKCGWVMQCAHCDVTTVYHVDRRLKTGGFVRCHHCLAELTLPTACPLCTKSINTFGLGTQRVEAELERKFGPSHALAMGDTMLRVDGDTMSSARDYFAALSRFGSGQVRVLLGTQMIAKGLDYPGVRLVGVVSADTSLSFPDFRAAERTFQLVAQVAGRAGRGEQAGRVIVQTANPQEPAIVLAARHDFVRFAEFELRQRRDSGLPPFARMARVVCRDVVLNKAQQAAAEISMLLRDLADELGLKVSPPAPCAIARASDHHRIEVQVIAASRTAIQRAFATLRQQGLLVSDGHTAVDVDPIALL